MNTKGKLVERFLSFPSDFRYAELKRLLECCGYSERDKGRTSGSRVVFEKEGQPPILLHKPHPPHKPVNQGRLREIAKQLGLW
ncbi:type II toxin-antitoxin system HicA family toxin [Eggerthella guodeyinii]|uniref:Addiction module toxin, HicA family n=1 Tax=Eggerthella guodeyinii TaxID=2690837 RepID=A0A6N7RPN7_9ACTN|nr:type II toxin-antitoxin system HicA family toxin [Eggerthella guodeyinii]MRX83216.1 addiction module toxin, HicA family [Eggerthella guodeyinii]